MNLKLNILLVALLSLAVGNVALVGQQATLEIQPKAAAMIPPYRTLSYPFVNPSGSVSPVFSHGYLIQFKPSSASPGESNIFLYDSAGHLTSEIAAWPQGASSVLITSVDVGAGGTLTFAGHVTKSDGSKYIFMATSALNGANARYFSTGNYQATQVALAKDGSIWSVGAEYYQTADVSGTAEKKWLNYDVLRHYDSAGLLLEHFLPRWGAEASYVVFKVDASSGKGYMSAYDSKNNHLEDYGPPFYGPQGGYMRSSGISIQSWLKALDDRIVLYDGRSGVVYQYRNGSSGMTRQYLAITDNSGSRINGFAVSNEGRIFASMETTTGSVRHRLGIYELSTSSSGAIGSWALLTRSQPFSSSLSGGFTLLGADRSSLVFRSRSGEISWSALE